MIVSLNPTFGNVGVRESLEGVFSNEFLIGIRCRWITKKKQEYSMIIRYHWITENPQIK